MNQNNLAVPCVAGCSVRVSPVVWNAGKVHLLCFSLPFFFGGGVVLHVYVCLTYHGNRVRIDTIWVPLTASVTATPAMGS